MSIDMDAITLQDCIDMYELNGAEVVLNDGKVMGFQYESEKRTSSPNWGSGQK